jgi:uncharacterized membrane protein YdjX (TVP38/TMEM64 family)
MEVNPEDASLPARRLWLRGGKHVWRMLAAEEKFFKEIRVPVQLLQQRDHIPLGRIRLLVALVGAALLMLMLASCSGRMPTIEETNAVVSRLRDHDAWAWAVGIGLIWADLVLPVPQTAIIAALGIVYGAVVGGLVGSFALITSGLLAYFLMQSHTRRFFVRLVGQRSLDTMGVFFDRSGTWAIVLTRSLPYSIPEAMTCLAGLSRMPVEQFLTALVLGSVPTAFVFAGIGAGWADQPLLALAMSYVLPVALVPIVLHTLRKRGEQ